MPGPDPDRLVVVGPLPPPVHGVSVMTEMLLRCLKELGLHAGHVDTADRRSLENMGRLDLGNVWLGLCHAARLVGALRGAPGAAVHLSISQTPWALRRDALFVAVAWLMRRRIYVQLHGGALASVYAEGGWALRLTIRFQLRRAHRLWVLTPSLRDAIPPVVPPSRVGVLPNAVDAAPGSETSVDDDGAAGFTLLHISNLMPAKGSVTLLKAVAELGERARGWRVVLAGSPYDDATRRRIEELADELEDRVNCTFLGPVDVHERDELLAECDVFAMPTTYALEGQPLVILEAMAAGVPVVATKHAGIPDTIRDGVDGLLVSPDDAGALASALSRMASEPHLRARLARSARVRYENEFSPERMRENLSDLLVAE